MNTAKLVNSALTGGGLIYPENLNVVIGNEDYGYPKGYVLDANAVASLTPSNGGNNINTEDFITKQKLSETFEKDENGIHVKGHINSIYLDEFENFSALYNLGNGSINSGFNNLTKSTSLTFGNCGYNNSNNSYIFGSSDNVFLNFQYVNTDNTKIKLIINEKELGQLLASKNFYFYINTKIAIKSDGFKILSTSNKNKNDYSVACNVESSQIVDGKYHITLKQDQRFKYFEGFDMLIAYINIITANSSFIYGDLNCILNNSDNSIALGRKNSIFNSNSSFLAGIGLCNFKNIDGSVVLGRYNFVDQDYNNIRNVFTIGAGEDVDNRKNALTIVNNNNSDLYINGIGGYDGTSINTGNTKSLQQVISDIETAVSLNSNGPWDVDITSEFVNGNVTIKPLTMWSISQNVKRVYFQADLKQGDVITIPDTLRMYIGWKISDNRFGMADWNAAGKKYTVTTDSKYVVLLDTPTVDAPGVQTNTLPSFGKVMLRTSNPEFKPTLQTDAKKDHTNDDKVMRGIAHQGFHKMERANSLAAFRAAAKEGWRYVETDTYMTSDGKFIVSHDPYLPTGWTNGTVTTTQGSYKYEEHTLAEILAFHGSNNEKTDTLEEFCKTCKECGLHPYIEIKQGKMADPNTLDTTNPRYSGKGYCIKILDIVNRCGLRGNATFIASVPYTLLLMARVDQSYRYGIVYFYQLKKTDAQWTTVLSKIDEYNNDAAASKAYLFLDANINNLKVADSDAVDTLVLKNCALEVWTATTKDDLDNLDQYVTGVTSDNIHAGEILAKKI